MRSEDYGKHLLDVENLLHKHSLVESQIQSQGESVQRINNVAQKFIKAKHPETRVIKERQSLLTQAFEVTNRINLNLHLCFFLFVKQQSIGLPQTWFYQP